jgi:hypothetical protein
VLPLLQNGRLEQSASSQLTSTAAASKAAVAAAAVAAAEEAAAERLSSAHAWNVCSSELLGSAQYCNHILSLSLLVSVVLRSVYIHSYLRGCSIWRPPVQVAIVPHGAWRHVGGKCMLQAISDSTVHWWFGSTVHHCQSGWYVRGQWGGVLDRGACTHACDDL